MPHAMVNGTSVYYEDSGTGQPVFLLFNGLGLALQAWGDVADGLAEEGRVIRWDMRGAGRTQLPDEPFPLETLAEDARALLDHRGVQQPVLVGHAFGGRVAQVFARDAPERVRALVICGTGGQFPPLPGGASVDPSDRGLPRDAWESAWLATYCSPAFSERQPERAARLLSEMWAQRSTANHVRFQRAATRLTPSPTYWGMATAPTLLVYGTDDRQGHPRNARDLASRLPDARLIWIEGAGHLAIREQPEQVLAAIRAFTKEQAL